MGQPTEPRSAEADAQKKSDVVKKMEKQRNTYEQNSKVQMKAMHDVPTPDEGPQDDDRGVVIRPRMF